ncbi:hypothetical protein BJ138DRAFT_1164974, partial [Hygrophoropsis aurantiaca]
MAIGIYTQTARMMLVKTVAFAALMATTTTSARPTSDTKSANSAVNYNYEFYVYSSRNFKGKDMFLGNYVRGEPGKGAPCHKCQPLNSEVTHNVQSFYFMELAVPSTKTSGFTVEFWSDAKCEGKVLKTYHNDQSIGNAPAIHPAKAVKVCRYN